MARRVIVAGWAFVLMAACTGARCEDGAAADGQAAQDGATPAAEAAPAPKPIVRQPAPDMGVVDQMRAQVRDTFRFGFESKEADARLKLAGELAAAVEKYEDAPTQYALLDEAMRVAASAGAAAEAMDALAKLNERFVIDPVPVKQAVLAEAEKFATEDDQEKDLAEAYLGLQADLAMAEKFDPAETAAEQAAKYANKSQDAVLKSLVKKRRDELKEQKRVYVLLPQYQETLKKNPDDPDANGQIGYYQAYLRGAWAEAMPFLMKAGDELTRNVAWLETNGQGARFQLAAADAWWEIAARKEMAAVRETVLNHAETMYTAVLPQLTGLLQTKAEKRLEQLQALREEAMLALSGGKQKLDFAQMSLSKKGTQLHEGKLTLLAEGTASSKIAALRAGHGVRVRASLNHGATIALNGPVNKDKKQTVAFQVMFDYDGRKLVCSSPNVVEGSEETLLPSLFDRNQRTQIALEVKKTEILVKLNNKTLCRYRHRMAPEEVQGLVITGPASVLSVVVER